MSTFTGLGPELQLLAWLSTTAAQGAGGSSGGEALSPSGATANDGPQSGSSGSTPASALLPDPSQSVGAVLAHAAAAPHTTAAQATTTALQAPIGTSAWIEQLGAQLTWMAQRGIESASLHVSPAELGPIEVRIALHGRDASVWFGAAHAHTRTALQQALPQLRHMFASQGLALADAGVFHEPPRQFARQSAAPAAHAVVTAREQDLIDRTRARLTLGLLDLYA